MVVYVKIVIFRYNNLHQRSLIFFLFFLSVGRAYKLYLVNYTNITTPGMPSPATILNQTIINMTNGGVIPTTITIR